MSLSSCEVTFGDGGSVRTSGWFLTLKNGPRRLIVGNDEPNFDNSANPLQSNFTILTFGAELDMATLECTNLLSSPLTQTVFFTLRTLG